MDNNEKESRCFSGEVRAVKQEDKTIVRGYAAMFDSLSENLGGFREIIAHGAFDDVLDNDVRALINHDSNLILGRTNAGTLRLGADSEGLWYEYDSPETSYARDLIISMERGDVNQSSFQFFVDKDDWGQDSEGRVIRTITKVRQLLDVAPVTFPAYAATTVSKRSLEEIEKLTSTSLDNSWEIAAEARKREIEILTITR